MPKSSLGISLGRRRPDAVSLLRLEVKPWGDNPGLVDKVDAANFIMSSLFPGLYSRPTVTTCGIDSDGALHGVVYAYPKVSTLLYSLAMSHGIILNKTRDDLEEKEAVIFSRKDNASLKYDSGDIVSHKWIGDVFDEEGGLLIVPPTPLFNGAEVTLNRKVLGVLELTYHVVRYSHDFKILPRGGTSNNLYVSTIFGRFRNGITWVEVVPPPYIDEAYHERFKCGWREGGYGGGGVIINPPGEDGRPITAPHHDRESFVDYCSQQPIVK